ncbi:MAG: hypothetical protein NC453_26780, partial [Muribaculum sp.]|nr:hypothetical protein [Muribaculum sp.]
EFSEIDKVYYVDEFLESSIALVLECKDSKNITKYTVVNTIEDLKSPLWFDYLLAITPQIILVRKGDRWGIINDKLQMKCFFEYDSLDEYISLSDNKIFIIGKKNGKYGLLNKDLSVVFTFEYTSITCNSKLGIFVLQSENLTILFDVVNNSITRLPFVISSVTEINEGCLIVERNKKYCVYDSDGQKFITDRWFDDIDIFQNGFALCDRRYILYRNGKIKDLGANGFNRMGNIVYLTKHIGDDEWSVSIYLKDEFVSKFNHKKNRHGFFYCRVLDDKYVEIGSYSDKYNLHTLESLYDLYGNKVNASLKSKCQTDKKKTPIFSNSYHAKRLKSHEGKLYEIDNVEEFENKHFSKSKPLTRSDSFEIIELASKLLRISTMFVDDGACYWSLHGYIYNDIKLWADIHISND